MKNGYTLLGGLAILFWSSTIGFSRGLTEQLGMLTAGCVIHTSAGLFGLGVLALRRQNGGVLAFFRLPRRYLFGCGALMISPSAKHASRSFAVSIPGISNAMRSPSPRMLRIG